MTGLTNSESKALSHTTELIESVPLQLVSINNYYTTNDDDVIYIYIYQIGYNKVLLLYYTSHTDRNIFHNYTINGNLLNLFALYFILNGTSSEYTLQGVYTANSYIGTISELQNVYLAMYNGCMIQILTHLRIQEMKA